MSVQDDSANTRRVQEVEKQNIALLEERQAHIRMMVVVSRTVRIMQPRLRGCDGQAPHDHCADPVAEERREKLRRCARISNYCRCGGTSAESRARGRCAA
mmetsp:Transcript_18988/g.52760  ORF Transcript_18988/g.52760 Transcript_18988/m.52760 type:complete len:100 (+) Transcript_18988:292-591(+)